MLSSDFIVVGTKQEVDMLPLPKLERPKSSLPPDTLLGRRLPAVRSQIDYKLMVAFLPA